MFWLRYDLSLEREVLREHHRHELRSASVEKLRELADLICQDLHMTKHLLNQHVSRVAELECKLALLEPLDDRFLQMAAELRRDLGGG